MTMLNFLKLMGGEDDENDAPSGPAAPREGRHDPYAKRSGSDDPRAPRHGRDNPYAPRDSRGEPLDHSDTSTPAPQRRSMSSAAQWDEFWTEQMQSGMAAFVDLFCRDERLVAAMRANRLRTVL